MKLSKGWIIAIIVVLFIILLFSWGTRIYNNLVTKEEAVISSGQMLKTFTSAVPISFRILLQL